MLGVMSHVFLAAPCRQQCLDTSIELPMTLTAAHRKKDELIHIEAAKKAGIEVIKRFSGGGTVLVDHNTVFSTLIMQAAAIPGLECYPRPVMGWSEDFYKPLFSPHGSFSLREHGEPSKSFHYCICSGSRHANSCHVSSAAAHAMKGGVPGVWNELQGVSRLCSTCRLHIR